MRTRIFVAAAALAATTLAAAALQQPALADDKCEPTALSGAVEQRLVADNKSPADIAGILQSGFKRGILEGRIQDASNCPKEAVEKALDMLAQKYK